MTTPKSFREVAEETFESDSTVNNSEATQEEPKQDVEETKPVEEQTEEVKPFTDKPDLAGKSPEELEQIYKDWQQKYTQTRQKESAELREYRQRLAQYEQHIKQLESAGNRIENPQLQDQRDVVQQQFDAGNMTIQEYSAWMRELARQDAESVAESVFEEKLTQREESTLQDQALQDFYSTDDRLDQHSPNFNPRMARAIAQDMELAMDEHLARYGTARGFNAKEITKKLISDYESEIDNIIKNRVQQNTIAAKSKVERVNRGNTFGTTSKAVPAKATLRDILKSQDAA